jgi:hypothetical protein
MSINSPDQQRQLTALQVELVTWYMQTFIPDPERGYDLMNIIQADNKYIRKQAAVTLELITKALQGQCRSLNIGARKYTFPYSIAVVPSHRDDWATCMAIDIDIGGEQQVRSCLSICQQYGLFAFAQLSISQDHDGGHIYIPIDRPQPSSLLWNIAARIQAAAGVRGEAYPRQKKANHQSLRLPLMMHLRAPGGPQRYPLLLASGQTISTTNPWLALEILQGQYRPNSAETLMAALGALPPISIDHPQPLHKSQVNPDSETSIIKWYNDNHDLEEELANLGGYGNGALRTCPFHDDRSPSLAIWPHSSGKLVCQCMSANSHCPAAERSLDAFNLFCMREDRTASAAVRYLVDTYHLGRQRTLRITDVISKVPAQAENHGEILQTAYRKLETELRKAAVRQRTVTVVSATPGLGKTHAAAALAKELHDAGKDVAIVAPTLMLARDWAKLLKDLGVEDVFVWRARTDICTCFDRVQLERLMELGYQLPVCRTECPYTKQLSLRIGNIGIYQHNHLHLNNGELLAQADVVIVDESPIGSLLRTNVANGIAR